MLTRLIDKLRFARDKQYVDRVYKENFHRGINWDNPTRFSEKINILKISPKIRNFSTYTDKYLVRDFVKKTIGEQYLIPLIAVYSSVEEINLEELPNQFVLKCTHGSGMNIICSSKASLDWPSAKRQLKTWLNSNFYHTFGRELQYNYIKPRIVCEKYLENNARDLLDFKFYCFSGKPEFVRVMSGRLTNIIKNTYYPNWKPAPFHIVTKGNDSDWLIPEPKNLKVMVDVATKLSSIFPFVRVDLYNVNGRIYFGELTFTPAAGIQIFDPDSYDIFYGSKF